MFKQAMATETDSMKWTLPGWRIERKYNNRVLIGDWDEERRKVRDSNMFKNLITVIENSLYNLRLNCVEIRCKVFEILSSSVNI